MSVKLTRDLVDIPCWSPSRLVPLPVLPSPCCMFLSLVDLTCCSPNVFPFLKMSCCNLQISVMLSESTHYSINMHHIFVSISVYLIVVIFPICRYQFWPLRYWFRGYKPYIVFVLHWDNVVIWFFLFSVDKSQPVGPRLVFCIYKVSRFVVFV